MKATNYIYASAKIRALEPLILDETDIERMVDAPDIKSAFKVLNDTDYGDNLLDVQPAEYRDALRADFQELHDFLQRVTPEGRLFELILLDRDFVNLRLFFKAKYFNIDIEKFVKENVIYAPNHLKDFVFENHIHSPETMQAYLTEQKGQTLDQEIKDVIYQIDKKINDKTRPDQIDSWLTQKYFDLKQELAKEIGSGFIKKYIKMEIDCANILMWLRLKRLGKDQEEAKQKLIRRGNADYKRLITMYNEEPRAIKFFINANFDQKVVEAFDKFCDDNNLFELEREMEDYKVRYSRLAKRYSYGPEVIFAYYLAKQNAITNIRIILTGKLNNLPTESIKQTLREVY